MIKFDLHIHSIASKYKEADGIVDESTVENVHVLLEKLNKNRVGLFSITDHNRFYVELYEKLDSLLAEYNYPNVKGLVAGVEFDVQMDPEMGKCHIITIFDAKNQHANYQRIHDAIEAKRLNCREDAYSKEEYENILRTIGLDVILIACQRNSIDSHNGHHNSLSESTLETRELLMSGYINALEFQKPKVEGILRDNLRTVPTNVMLLTGSDCHEWASYPNHDSTQGDSHFNHSKAKILPTFKGLLMAVTSPETRINQPENRNVDYIQSIFVNNVEYPFVHGLIAIIGENGSGKSTILKIIHGDTREAFVKKIQRDNNICCDRGSADKRLFLRQGQIVSDFGNGKLFPSENFLPVDHESFRNAYTEFANGILDFIYKKINAKNAFDKLGNESITYNELIHAMSYFIRIELPVNYGLLENPHQSHDLALKKLLESVEKMKSDNYYSGYQSDLQKIIEILAKIHERVHLDNEKCLTEKIVKNYIISAINKYNLNIKSAATSQEMEQRDFLARRQNILGDIVDAMKLNTEDFLFPELPTQIEGFSTNPKCGFSFNSEASYHNKDVLDIFLTKMFTKSYSSIEKLKNIDTINSLVAAVNRCSDKTQLKSVFQHNLDAFLEEMCQETNYIVDMSQGSKELGSTLGELSLAYFKYMTEYEDDHCIILIDQPEDHISNNNISKKLLKYFNSIRNKKQVIMVTHNPLMVVNQDVDQVLFVRKNNDRISVVSGCLEYEDEENSILDIVANNMDGGRDSIEKRLRVYGKDN